MTVIYRDDLTTAELETIEEIYKCRQHCPEFWAAFIDYQKTGRDDSVVGQTRNCGVAAAMRVIRDREMAALAAELGMPPLATMRARMSIYDMDDIDSLHMILGMQEARQHRGPRRAV